jgi:multicomponent Na+:H+ antiporter subunit A
MVVGAYLALYRTNLKLILAYSTVSSLGAIVLLLGIGTSGAIKAAMVFLLAHALYKGSLFMLAGAIYHETGTQDVEQLGNLRHSMPILAGITILAAISISGLGPVLSFIGKELLFEAVLGEPRFSFLFVPAAILAAAVSVAVAFIMVIRPFFGPGKATPKHPHEPPMSLWLGPGILAILGLLIGLFPALVSRSLIAPAAVAIYGEQLEVSLALWHGFNTALLLSAISITFGVLFYFTWATVRSTSSRLERFVRWGPQWWYNAGLDLLNSLAAFQTHVLQSGKLHNYIAIIIIASVGLVTYTLANRTGGLLVESTPILRFYEVGLAILMLASALTAVRTRSRLMAVAALGVVGYGVALIFVFYGAPDLAMTQILIETMTVILLVLVLYHLPGFSHFSSRKQRSLDVVLAGLAGVLMTMLVLIASTFHEFPPISEYFTEHAVDMAHGRNIVNVILVDFRALDTLGEITVLSLAGIGVYALLKLRLNKNEGSEK